MATVIDTNDVGILSRAIRPENGDLSAEAARDILSIQLAPEDLSRMKELGRRSNNGTITDDEKAEAEAYNRAARFIGLLHVRAKCSLRGSGTGRR